MHVQFFASESMSAIMRFLFSNTNRFEYYYIGIIFSAYSFNFFFVTNGIRSMPSSNNVKATDTLHTRPQCKRPINSKTGLCDVSKYKFKKPAKQQIKLYYYIHYGVGLGGRYLHILCDAILLILCS